MQFDRKKFMPQLLIILGLAAIAIFYSYPELQGKALYQGDTVQWQGMAKEGIDYHEKTGDNVFWSNSQFGGMPTFTFYVPESNNYIASIHTAILGIFGLPAAFFFIGMVCFYMMMRAFKINQWLAIAGAIAYAFTSFNIDSIVAGHNTKVFAICYFPGVIAGLVYLYRSEWWKGIPIMGITLALMISTAHYQIMYYALIAIVFLVITMLVIAARSGRVKEFFVSSAVAGGIAILCAGLCLQSIMSVSEYNKVTMRGGQSELTIVNHDTDKKGGGLDKEYAFRWSNSIGETFCLMIPYLYGGGSNVSAEDAPKFSEVTGGQATDAPLYWGDQPFLGASTYFGAIICFLFVFGVMVVRSPYKWWIVAASALSIMMSWGRHFAGLNYFLFDTLPMLNKFRTPSMAIAIAQLLFPLMAAWGLNEVITGRVSKEDALKKLKIALGITAGICVVIAFAGTAFFDFTGAGDKQFPEQYRQQLIAALREDRQALAMKSALTSAVYILLAGGLIWAFLKDKIKNVNLVVGGIAALIAIDIFSVAHKYLNDENYVEKDQVATIQPRDVDTQIMQDKDPYYRVLDISKNVYNDATQSYFHKCIGGYSPTKMEQYQDLIDVHMSGSFNSQVLNMLNTKYIIYNAGQDHPVVSANPDACGNAWFVNDVKWAKSADDEILSLNASKLGDTTKVADEFKPLQTAVMRNAFEKDMQGYTFGKDSTAKIKLSKYGLNDLSFTSSNSQNGLAVFSDIYYPYGWHAYVDGKETPIMKADYVLRAIKIPAGNHTIDFKFHPDSFYKGDRIALICCILLIALFGWSFVQLFRQNSPKTA
ncbi:MAG: YfhO family protein [Bacteroidetes bacterium]|nr:YfhO family protein [Bacteroidota bacterium]